MKKPKMFLIKTATKKKPKMFLIQKKRQVPTKTRGSKYA